MHELTSQTNELKKNGHKDGPMSEAIINDQVNDTNYDNQYNQHKHQLIYIILFSDCIKINTLKPERYCPYIYIYI